MGQANRSGVLVTALIALLCARWPAQDHGERPHLSLAIDAARWISTQIQRTDHGVRWASKADQKRSAVDHLYSGGAGVILFLLELHAATDDQRWLTMATEGGNEMVARMEKIAEGPAGLYTGAAGVGFALEALHARTGEDRFRRASGVCRMRLAARARPGEGGVDWGPVTDIISGTSGTGLWLAQAPSTLPVAVRAGRRLLTLGKETKHGTSWAMSPGYARVMPNFSHGTAGVAYFLADLHARTRDRRFLDGALAGARHLLAIADKSKGLRIHHHAPGGEDLYYLGWCHGPPGTARLFWRLWRITGEAEWKKRAIACADAVLASGIPKSRTAGFWENVGQCCGTAGVADFLLSLHRGTGERRFLDACAPFTKDLHERARVAGATGRSWVQAEHRVRPDLLEAQTGWAQGAAGIGMWFLRRDAQQTGRKLVIRLPDDPWN